MKNLKGGVTGGKTNLASLKLSLQLLLLLITCKNRHIGHRSYFSSRRYKSRARSSSPRYRRPTCLPCSWCFLVRQQRRWRRYQGRRYRKRLEDHPCELAS
ncbi:hypothetical protein EYC84_005447 [Monilinia fructicola]|uniref:Uncharacterized protein n=1 Tax=Monilinia fructicola TaxID=38448 RepID=A0A5M9K1P0_MONFR|nr:hypothetical protein EYC84_005447 [Monilinia fructicola]